MQNNQPLKLLIVDDESTFVVYTQKIYQKKGFITFGATNGQVAWEIFQRERPHFVIIDVHIDYSPITGLELLEKIKTLDKQTCCIMVGHRGLPGEEEKAEKAKELGAFAYFLKPVEIEDLDKCIEEITGGKKYA